MYVETLWQISYISTKAFDPEKLISFKDALVVLHSLLKIIKEIKNQKYKYEGILCSIKSWKFYLLILYAFGGIEIPERVYRI